MPARPLATCASMHRLRLRPRIASHTLHTPQHTRCDTRIAILCKCFFWRLPHKKLATGVCRSREPIRTACTAFLDSFRATMGPTHRVPAPPRLVRPRPRLPAPKPATRGRMQYTRPYAGRAHPLSLLQNEIGEEARNETVQIIDFILRQPRRAGYALQPTQREGIRVEGAGIAGRH